MLVCGRGFDPPARSPVPDVSRAARMEIRAARMAAAILGLLPKTRSSLTVTILALAQLQRNTVTPHLGNSFMNLCSHTIACTTLVRPTTQQIVRFRANLCKAVSVNAEPPDHTTHGQGRPKHSLAITGPIIGALIIAAASVISALINRSGRTNPPVPTLAATVTGSTTTIAASPTTVYLETVPANPVTLPPAATAAPQIIIVTIPGSVVTVLVPAEPNATGTVQALPPTTARPTTTLRPTTAETTATRSPGAGDAPTTLGTNTSAVTTSAGSASGSTSSSAPQTTLAPATSSPATTSGQATTAPVTTTPPITQGPASTVASSTIP